MPNIFPSVVQAHPNYTMPETIVKLSQRSGAFDLLAGAEPMARLSEGDLYVYGKTLDIRTKVAGGQAAYNQLPSVTINATQISTPTYLLRTRAEYDHHDTAAAGQWDVALPEAQRLGMRQGIFQQLRNMLLRGMNPLNGEGMLNAAGITLTTLPPDSNGNDTVETYDNGEMAFFLLGIISGIKTRTLQLGEGQRIVICGPQRILGAFEYQNIVQLTQFQRVGAGSQSTAGVVKDVARDNQDVVDWVYDDTLIGAGAGGDDAVIITIPEIKKPVGVSNINTNAFADLKPGLMSTNLMLCDMAAPREIPTPLPGGAIDVVSELRATSGWSVRPEATTVVSMQYQ